LKFTRKRREVNALRLAAGGPTQRASILFDEFVIDADETRQNRSDASTVPAEPGELTLDVRAGAS
jgi:hypothetical protein